MRSMDVTKNLWRDIVGWANAMKHIVPNAWLHLIGMLASVSSLFLSSFPSISTDKTI